jgi:hypothetical protein
MATQYYEDKELTEFGERMLAGMQFIEKPKIKFLMLTADKCKYLGKCSRATGKWKYLSHIDYVIEVWETFWSSTTDSNIREALVYHELRHIHCTEKEDGELVWSLNDHDIEEFIDVVNKYGAWRRELQILKDTLNGVK